MSDEVIRVLETITMLFLVILTGLFIRRKRWLDARSTEHLSRFAVDIAFPALLFTSMLRIVDPQTLGRYWPLPLVGVAVLIFGMGLGYLVSPLLNIPRHPGRGSVAFTVGNPNWLFIPLPIAIALFAEQGERVVLLFHVGALLVFWSVGVWVVRGDRPNAAALRSLLLNPGLVATLLGILVALIFPWTRTLEQLDVTEAGLGLGFSALIVQAMVFVGDVTVPLAMIVTGSLLAEAGLRDAWNGRVIAISALRLLLFPALVILLLRLAGAAGLHVATADSMTIVIIAAAPVAVTCSIVAEKYGGDMPLISSAIFVSTVASVATLPAIVWFMQLMGF